MKSNLTSVGRLKQKLDPIAQAILFPKKEKSALLNELKMIATLNEVHLIGLYKSKLLPPIAIKKIIKLISILRKKEFNQLLSKPAERGSYILFENYLTETLGMKTAGSLHIGRSRNDMNATMFKLKLRQHFKNIYHNLCSLRSVLLQQAQKYLHMPMPIYSQFQVAQVGTFGYYLLSIEEALSRDLHFLKGLLFSLDECPLGAAAGCGTSFPIDYSVAASMLGFTHCCKTALDAVANRDLALRLLSNITVLGTTLSRLAQDYQLWTTQEYAFFDVPDSLCGGSSMMPQKKNPYLIEVIKGKSASLNGMLVQALSAMHSVPFGNSMEVGTEAVLGINIALDNANNILTLTELLVSKAVPIEIALMKSINQGVAMATNVAEHLVQEKNIPFRQAHQEIGDRITQAVSQNLSPAKEILKFMSKKNNHQSEFSWADRNEYGGGSGKKSRKSIWQNANKRLKKDISYISIIETQWNVAEIKLQSNIKKILNKRTN